MARTKMAVELTRPMQASCRVSAELKADLEEIARIDEISISDFVRSALLEAVKQRKSQPDYREKKSTSDLRLIQEKQAELEALLAQAGISPEKES